MDERQDAFGLWLLAELDGGASRSELIERDDGYIDSGSEQGLYFSKYEDWPPSERDLIDRAKGRVLDVGCGAGRHALYLQQKGLHVTAIDNSPGAVEVSKRRGVDRADVRGIAEISEFGPVAFDTVLLMGNNFGLFSDMQNAKQILAALDRITAPGAMIFAGTRDPYQTDSPDHLEYHERNRSLGRMPGQIRMRVRYARTVGDWFDYLMVSRSEMKEILANTRWEVNEFIESGDANYFAVMRKRSDVAI